MTSPVSDSDAPVLDESGLPVGPLEGPAPATAVVAYGAGDAGAIPAPSPAPVKLPTTPGRARASLFALSVMAFLVVTNEIAPIGLIKRIAEDIGRSESEVGF